VRLSPERHNGVALRFEPPHYEDVKPITGIGQGERYDMLS
jgi:hypothetical protein